MAERSKDAEDRLLESMFASAPLADDGFSVKVVKKVRRQLWSRRLLLPTAVLIGGAIAFKPLTGLVAALVSLSVLIPQDAITAAASSIPQLQTVILGAILLGAGLLGLRLMDQ